MSRRPAPAPADEPCDICRMRTPYLVADEVEPGAWVCPGCFERRRQSLPKPPPRRPVVTVETTSPFLEEIL